MYKPAPPRPKKTNIVRSRTGCKTCRARRKKCDEKKPACSTCKRLGKRCETFEPKFEFKEINVLGTSPPSHDGQPNVERILPTETLVDKLDYHDGSTLDIDLHQSTLHFAPAVDTLTLNLSDDAIAKSFVKFNVGSTPNLQSEANAPLLAIDGYQSNHELDIAFDFSSNEPHPCFLGETFDQTTFAIGNRDPESEAEAWQDTEDCGPQDSMTNQAYLACAKTRSPSHELFSFMDASWIPEWIPIPNNEICYMNLWDTQCLPILHPAFRRFNILQTLSPLEIDAIVGLSACRLSRALPQKKSFSSSDIPGMAFRPDKNHQALSQHHYRSAMRRVASWVESEAKSRIGATMAVLVLFCYFESSMGNFSEFALHSNGIDIMMKLLAGKGDDGGGFEPEIRGAWLQARMQNWWRRFHFSTPSFQSEPLPDLVQPEPEATLHGAENRRALILSILCKSLNISTMALVRAWDLPKATEPQSTSDGAGAGERPDSRGSLDSEGPDWQSSYKTLLDVESKSLRDWNSRLPLSELPIESFTSPRRSLDTSEILDVQALYFNTHESAMNYAYYITALVIQKSATELVSADEPAEDTEFWISIMLRIAAGIKWEECVQFNVYTIGFSGLLLACAVRSTNINIGLWIQDWLEERQRISGFEEGSFPVLQILQVLRVVNKERSNGYDVLGIFQPTDDGGGIGKFDSYHSQRINSILVYKRCRATGQLLSNDIPLY